MALKARRIAGLTGLIVSILLTLFLIRLIYLLSTGPYLRIPWWIWWCPVVTVAAALGCWRIVSWKPWRIRFSLITMLLTLIFVGACLGLWFKRDPWGCDFVLPGDGAAFSRDGRWIAAWNHWGPTHVCDAQTGRQHVVLKGHANDASHAAFSPDGKRLLTVHRDGGAFLWDTETGKELAELVGQEGRCSFGVFSPDGLRVLTIDNIQAGATHMASVHMWDVASGERLFFVAGHFEWVSRAVFSPDGQRFVSSCAGDNSCGVWDSATGRKLAELRGCRPSFFPDGRRLATVDKNNVLLWDTKTFERMGQLEGHAGEVSAVAYSPDARRAVTSSGDGTARVWDVASRAELALLEGHTTGFLSACFSPDGKRILAGGFGGSARLWDAETFEEMAVLKRGDGYVISAFSPDGRQILTKGEDRACVWSRRRPGYAWGVVALPEFWIAVLAGGALLVIAVRGLLRHVSPLTLTCFVLLAGFSLGLYLRRHAWVCELVIRGHTHAVADVTFSADGERLVTAALDGTARVWDAESGAELNALEAQSDRIWYARFSPDGRRIVTSGGDETARVWDVESGKVIRKLEGHWAEVICAAFSPNGQRIVTTGEESDALVWDVEQDEEPSALEGHSDMIWCASFSPDSRRIVTAACDGCARVWDAETGEEQLVLKGHKKMLVSAYFSPDGQKIITASKDFTTRVWDAANGKELAILDVHYPFRSASFSPDGQRIVTTTEEDDCIRIWDAGTYQELTVLKGHTKMAWPSAFSPDGKRIATGSWDRTVRVWSRRRPEHAWGLVHMPELWGMALSACVLLIIAARNIWRRYRERPPQDQVA